MSAPVGPVMLADLIAHKANGSPIAKEALDRIGALFTIERAVAGKPPDQRQAIQMAKAKPALDSRRLQITCNLFFCAPRPNTISSVDPATILLTLSCCRTAYALRFGMAVISTRYDFATEITIDGWFVTDFPCHVVLAGDSDCVDSYWVEHLYVHASRRSHDTVPPRRDELEREITQADPLYRWVSAELASRAGQHRSDEAWGSFLDQIRSEAA